MTVIHNTSENTKFTEFMAPLTQYQEVSEACTFGKSFSKLNFFFLIFLKPFLKIFVDLFTDQWGPTVHLAQAKSMGPVETNPVRSDPQSFGSSTRRQNKGKRALILDITVLFFATVLAHMPLGD